MAQDVHADSMNVRSHMGKLSLAFFQWKKLVILLFVGLYVQSLYYSVMNSRESQAEYGALYQSFGGRLFMGRHGQKLKSRKRLGACRRRFVWRKPFLARFESHWKPFLTSESLYLLMDRPFRRELEKVLWFHELPFGLRNSVLSAFATLQLLPQQELPESFERLWCQRCIVVGNGYSIRSQHFVKMIDSHHVIIRLNDAPVKEHQKDVGERTSIRLFFPESALLNPLENNDNETLMVFVPFKPLDFVWLREVLLKTKNKTNVGFWRQPPCEWNGNVSRLRVLNPYVTYEATYKLLQLKTWSRRYATMGIIALNLALHMCQEVNIAGFGYPGNHDNATPIHYYNMSLSRKKELFQHNLTAERNWLLKMIKQGVIADIANPSFQAQNN
ncbi:CMP-N-acetylneuraminate-beta-galactosamide-alpha-2,3-sialyltransferase 4-like [Rhea pennata]|uniref:CMP-N-acetylneuraminate-beta-galactosamide- alpha-2,3-sialyltransferase 4-like n=1 Tax=Rhea pennata TaxID=8795 RepID=UPI002E269B3B